MRSGIYEIRNLLDGRRYVGSAVNIEGRFKDHLKGLRSGKHHNVFLQRSWDKHGERYFAFFVVEYCHEEDLLRVEQSRIDSYDDSRLYNICKVAGSALGVKRRPEGAENRSEGQKGRKHSEETRKKISEANSRRRHTESSKKKISEALKGRVLTEEWKLKISESKKRKDVRSE